MYRLVCIYQYCVTLALQWLTVNILLEMSIVAERTENTTQATTNMHLFHHFKQQCFKKLRHTRDCV